MNTISADAPIPVAPGDILENARGARTNWTTNLPFISVHFACLLVLWTGITPTAAWLGLATLLVRMFGLTGGYHRYFCHRSFKTSRVFQFLLAWAGASAPGSKPPHPT